MNYHRFTAALLTAALATSLASPVGAVTSSFSDIHDTETAINADVLRLMGVVDGVGDNQFNPQGTLTRGAFCRMLVTYMGLEHQLSLYSTRTIFSDVPSSHWAAPYINLAASTQSGEEGMIIAGVGDGTFRPDASITVAEAVTILIRVLDYTDIDTGAIWPQGYLNLASSIGLTDGMEISSNNPLTRSQAAQLFVQALSTDTKAGIPYYETLGSGYLCNEDVMILSTNVKDDSGESGSVRTSIGTYSSANGDINPSAMQGRRGVLILNSKQELVAFLPDDSTAITITLSEHAQATYLKSSTTRYTISSTTPVFLYGEENSEDSYANKWTDLTSGSRVTLFTENGAVTALYLGETTTSEEAIVITETPTRSTFYSITGGSIDFNILRNGEEIALKEIVVDDVATYDSTTNSLIVSDLRISAVYESGSPNSTTPTSIHILGHDFPVLEGALDVSDQIKVGDTACFLLTADGSIAAIKTTSRARNSTVYGIAGENSVDILLPAGGTITLTGANTINDNLQNRLVSVSSFRADQITATRVGGSSAGTFDVVNMTLGGRYIAANFALYEEVAYGAVVELPRTSLDMESIPSSQIAGYRVDGSGHVDIIVLDGVTGDGYTYGKLVEIPAIQSDASMDPGTNRMVCIENSGNGLTPAISNLICATSFKTGDFGGVTIGKDGKAGSLVLLDNRGEVSRTDFFTTDGITYVTVKGTAYPVSSQVECYSEGSDSWMTLSAIRGYSDTLTIYTDPLSNTVRVITAAE